MGGGMMRRLLTKAAVWAGELAAAVLIVWLLSLTGLSLTWSVLAAAVMGMAAGLLEDWVTRRWEGRSPRMEGRLVVEAAEDDMPDAT